MQEAIIEAIIIGIILILLGWVSVYLVPTYFKIELPDECKKWNDKHAMEISLFLVGVLLRLGVEVTGVNKWYVNKWSGIYKV
jgi:hypothetical protein